MSEKWRRRFAAHGLPSRILRGAGVLPLVALLTPSWLVGADVIPAESFSPLRAMLRETNALGLIVTLLVTGSILGLSQDMLSTSARRVLVMSLIASAAAAFSAILVACVISLPVKEVVFLLLAPMMAGGVSAGAIPLASGYAQAFALPVGELLARILPVVLVANLLAMLLASGIAADLRWRGGGAVDLTTPKSRPAPPVNADSALWLAIAAIVIWATQEAVSAAASASGAPSSLLVLLLAGGWRLLGWGKRLRQSIVALYRLCLRLLIYPLLVAVGLLLTPWRELANGFTSPELLLPIAAAVAAMAAAGACVSPRLGLTRAEGATLALTRAAMGGTGAVAILSAAGRLELMPQAQILTRFGGALTLAAALAAAGAFGDWAPPLAALAAARRVGSAVEFWIPRWYGIDTPRWAGPSETPGGEVQLRHLRYFVKIVDAGSFSRAAAVVHVAQPALSQQISELEEKLGTPLLVRHPRGVAPTPAGRTLYREAVAILRQIEQLPGLVRSTGGEPQGVVDLGMSSTLAAMIGGPFIQSCRERLPKIMIKFHISDSETLKRDIAAHALDLALAFEDELTGGYARAPLFRQRLYFVPGKPFAPSAGPISIERLTEIPLVMPTAPNILRSVLETRFAAMGAAPNIISEGDQLSSIMSLVRQGLGGTVLPRGSAFEGDSSLGAPLLIEPALFLTASVLWSNDAALGVAAEAVKLALMAYVGEHMRERAEPGLEAIS